MYSDSASDLRGDKLNKNLKGGKGKKKKIVYKTKKLHFDTETDHKQLDKVNQIDQENLNSEFF